MNQPGMTGSPDWWRTVLDRLGALILHAPGLDDVRGRLPADAIAQDSLLRPGASADELAALETRLGRPPSGSYRSLLQATNGFALFGQRLGRLLRAAEADWFPKRNPDAARQIEVYLNAGNPKRPAAARDPKWTVDIPLHALEITEALDGASLLLHPRRGRGGGEWDVWFYQGGAGTRLATLPDLIEQDLRALSKRSGDWRRGPPICFNR